MLTTWVRFIWFLKYLVSKLIFVWFIDFIIICLKFQLNNKLFSFDGIGILIWFFLDGWGNCVVVSFMLKENLVKGKMFLSIGLIFS